MHLRYFKRHSSSAFVKGVQSLNLPYLLLFLTLLLPLAQGTTMFEVQLLSYRNPGNRDWQWGCCSGQEVDGKCVTPCRTFFTVCLGPLSDDPSPQCSFGQLDSSVMSSGSLAFPWNSLLQLPVTIHAWPGAFSLSVAAKHKGASSSVLIERDIIKRTSLLPSSGWQNVSHVGSVANMSFSYRVKCQPDYFGDQCAKYCKPRDDHLGHYTCDSNGTRVCLPGWSSPATYCDKAVCTGCDLNHGSCSRPNTCQCRYGWQGQNCTECVKRHGCFHGMCTKPWECVCLPGWGGMYCDLDLVYCSRHNPCKNGAYCINASPGGYACRCTKGFTGRNCETDIDECSSDPCRHGGNCTDLLGDYNCSCPEGFTGKSCERNIDDCTSGSCINGGTCVDGVRGFNCSCPAGFTGRTCEVVLPTLPTTNQSNANETAEPTLVGSANQTIGKTHNPRTGSGPLSHTVMVVLIVVAVLIVIFVCTACIVWKFWRKRKAAVQNAARAVEMDSHVNAKHLDSVESESKHSAGAKSRTPEIIINFVARKQVEKNTNKTQEMYTDESKDSDKGVSRSSVVLSDITTTTAATTTTKTKATTSTAGASASGAAAAVAVTAATPAAQKLDELNLPNRCFDQGYWQEVELEI